MSSTQGERGGCGRGRTPLTILEGIVFVLLYPQSLEKNACFMLSGSRRGDRRVPALWISGKAPKLGWCDVLPIVLIVGLQIAVVVYVLVTLQAIRTNTAKTVALLRALERHLRPPPQDGESTLGRPRLQ